MDSFKSSREQQFDADGASDSDDDDAPTKKKPRLPKGKKQKSIAGNSNMKVRMVLLNLQIHVWPQNSAQVAAVTSPMNFSILTTLPCLMTSALQSRNTRMMKIWKMMESRLSHGIKIEPFNLRQERMEGYFDLEGNYVEYGNGNEIKDAWLDSVEVDTRFAERHLKQPNQERVDDDSLSSEEIGKIKRRIANALHPGETHV